jgi:hypothetical protein
MLQSYGSEVEVSNSDRDTRPIGVTSEFCIGGPHGNARTASHLDNFVPGFHIEPYEKGSPLEMSVGQTKFLRKRGKEEYVLIFKIFLDQRPETPLWIICGQVAICNQAAARYLQRNLTQLRRQYGTSKPFCIALRVVDSESYGYSNVKLVGDFTNAAFGSDRQPTSP